MNNRTSKSQNGAERNITPANSSFIIILLIYNLWAQPRTESIKKPTNHISCYTIAAICQHDWRDRCGIFVAL